MSKREIEELQSWLEGIRFRRDIAQRLAAAQRFGATTPFTLSPSKDGYGYTVTL